MILIQRSFYYSYCYMAAAMAAIEIWLRFPINSELVLIHSLFANDGSSSVFH